MTTATTSTAAKEERAETTTQRLNRTTQTIRAYQKSDAFSDDLEKAFKEASRLAVQENERLGIAVVQDKVETPQS